MDPVVLIEEKKQVPKFLVKATKLLDEKAKNRTRSGIIRFGEVYRILSPYFRLTRGEVWDLLTAMENAGLVQIVPHNGVRIVGR